LLLCRAKHYCQTNANLCRGVPKTPKPFTRAGFSLFEHIAKQLITFNNPTKMKKCPFKKGRKNKPRFVQNGITQPAALSWGGVSTE
jgi:hypothetical protein